VLTRKPRDCTDSLLPQFAIDVQSPGHRASHTMPNKTKARRRVVSNKPKTTKPKKATPFSDAGAVVGSKLGAMFNAPYLKGVGKWLGSGIGQIFGSGDYQIVGGTPNYNVMMNGNQIPKFSSTSQTNIVCHREYLGDFTGTSGFVNNTFPLNPGMAQTFPWLSAIAQSYQEYKFHGLIFEFRPLITDFVTSGAPGVVVMATNYNADATAYTTKQQMENSEYAVSVKPTRELMHGVECATSQTVLPQLYVRTSDPPTGQDLRLYDLGLFQFATQANPIQSLGELWVSYCVEFFKPILPSEVGGAILSTTFVRSTIGGATPFGTIQVSKTGDLNSSMTSTSLTFFAHPGNNYEVTRSWVGTATAVLNFPSQTFTGLVQLPVYDGINFIVAPNNAVVSDRMIAQETYKCTLLNPGFVTMTEGTGGTYPGGSRLTLVVTEVSSQLG